MWGASVCIDIPSGYTTARSMWSSQLLERKTITSSFEHFSNAWLRQAQDAEAEAPQRNMNFIDHVIEPPDRNGRESHAQTCSLGQHTLFDTYGAYPLRTPWLAEFTHSAYDPFELLDGDTALLVCLMQAQLAADRENSTTQSFVSTAALNTQSFAEKRRPASGSRRIDRTHQILCPSQHSSASRQKQAQQTSRRTFFVRKKIGRNRIFRTFSRSQR